MDIGIYTTARTWRHKALGGYWSLRIIPKVKAGDRLWFAFGGRWRGYFRVSKFIEHRLEDVRGCEVWFDDWNSVYLSAFRKPFQGFTYKVPKVQP